MIYFHPFKYQFVAGANPHVVRGSGLHTINWYCHVRQNQYCFWKISLTGFHWVLFVFILPESQKFRIAEQVQPNQQSTSSRYKTDPGNPGAWNKNTREGLQDNPYYLDSMYIDSKKIKNLCILGRVSIVGQLKTKTQFGVFTGSTEHTQQRMKNVRPEKGSGKIMISGIKVQFD